jgi:tripartite-type tricarboxylate transporter receptor subunit TctC
MFRKTALATLALLGATAFAPGTAVAAYPDKPVKIVVPFGPGGPGDLILRVLTEELKKKWGQPVIVDYKPGAAGIIAHRYLVEQPGDGLTLLQGAASFLTYELVNKDLGFKPLEDVKIAAIYGVAHTGFVINGALPVRTVPEFVAYTKANQGKVNYASLGRSAVMLAHELFEVQTGAQMTEVPYKNMGDLTAGIIRSDVQIGITTLTQIKGLVDEAKLRPLFLFADSRIAAIPDVPTYKEVGLPNFKVQFWQTLMVSSKVPADIRQKINDDVREIVGLAEMREKLLTSGNEPMSPSVAEIDRMTAEAASQWAAAARAANIVPE